MILENPVKVYNLEVKNFHTYFVGEKGVWVHNMCGKVTNRGGEGGSKSYSSFRDLMSPEEAQRYDKYWQRNARDYNTLIHD